MKSKHVLFGILVLSILIFSMTTAASAVTYTIGVKAKDRYVWEIRTLDPSYTGFPPDFDVGDRATMLINNVEETTTDWILSYSYTGFAGSTGNKIDAVPKDPDYWGIIILVCALPVNEYLTEAYGPFVSGNKITFSIMGTVTEFVFDTSTGVMSSTKYTEGGTVMYEIVLVPAIPGYELPILLGVTAISTLGLIYLVMKKK